MSPRLMTTPLAVQRFFGILVAGLAVTVWGCTLDNPGFGPGKGDGPGGVVDAAGKPADLAVPAAADLARLDLRPPLDLRVVDAGACPAAVLPPTSCNQRSPGRTAIQVLVRVDSYNGVITGSNGLHEDFDGTIVCTSWVYQSSAVDTRNVEVAMNITTMMNPNGLPREIPLPVGKVVALEGEYIPASQAKATNANGPAAVIHYTHSPCGFVVIDGMTYR